MGRCLPHLLLLFTSLEEDIFLRSISLYLSVAIFPSRLLMSFYTSLPLSHLQLVCNTPPYPVDGPGMDVKVVLVDVQEAEYAICLGSCWFQYRSDHTPYLSHLQHGAGPGDSLDFEGYLRAASGVRTLFDSFLGQPVCGAMESHAVGFPPTTPNTTE